MKPAHCHVAERGCLNPAGYGLASGGVALSDGAKTTWECPICNEATCKACRETSLGRVVCTRCARAEARKPKRPMNMRTIQATRALIEKSRSKIDSALRCLNGAMSPAADKTLGVTKAEYVDRMLGEADSEIQSAIDTMYDAQNKIEPRSRS